MLWEQMKKIAKLNNQGSTQEAQDYLNTLEIESNTPIADMAITVFDITKENVINNIELAKKLSNLEYTGFREAIRSGFLEEILKDVEGETNV